MPPRAFSDSRTGPGSLSGPSFYLKNEVCMRLLKRARLGMPSRPMAYRPNAKPWPKRSLRAAPMLIESDRRDAAPNPR